jgi:hypothetical protein
VRMRLERAWMARISFATQTRAGRHRTNCDHRMTVAVLSDRSFEVWFFPRAETKTKPAIAAKLIDRTVVLQLPYQGE